MSKLSERCQIFLNHSGQTVYNLAKISGLDRASIHRLVSGKRLPSKEFLTRFCHALRMNPYEEKEILELYEEAKVGSHVYQNRKCILELFSKVDLAVHKPPVPLEIPGPYAEFPSYTDTLSSTKVQLIHLMESAFSGEDTVPFLLSNLPADGDFPLHRILNQLYLKYQKSVRFEHFITLASNPAQHEDQNCNLMTISHMLPLSLSRFDLYLPRYTYSHIFQSDFQQLQWPYYLAAKGYVAAISTDLRCSLLYRSPDQVQLYCKELHRIYENAHPLMQIPRTPKEALEIYIQVTSPRSKLSGSLHNMPCLTNCIPPEIYQESILRSHLSKELHQLFFSTYITQLPDTTYAPCYFTMNGLIHFLKTGEILGQLTAFVRPLSPRERRMILETFLKNNGKNFISCCLLKLDLHIPENLYVELLSNHQLLFCYFLSDLDVRFVLIQESSVYEAFADFHNYLSEESNSYSLEETNDIICKMMEQYLPETL